MTISRTGLGITRMGTDPADLYLDSLGNLVMVNDAEAVGQHARQRLMTWYGEWFLDRFAGVQWLRDILGKAYDPIMAESVVKTELLNTDGVTEITAFSVKFDRISRGLNPYDISVLTEYDNEVNL